MSLRYQFLSSSHRSWTSPGFNVGAFVLQHLRKQHHQETHLCMYAEDTAIMNTGISQDQVTNNLNSYLAELADFNFKIAKKYFKKIDNSTNEEILNIYSYDPNRPRKKLRARRQLVRENALTILLACKESGTSSPEDQVQGASLDIAKRYLHQSSTLVRRDREGVRTLELQRSYVLRTVALRRTGNSSEKVRSLAVARREDLEMEWRRVKL
ncbi:hypothetical protein AVEN_86654-1 [Araneus ventricosus]|uniref:Uncharacterized protein n=1 Tax=Araneus ventricosus TaxID=182803 RepID=A0A4Y2V8K1_ARAVE|nr:hypothetical protein AVEN_86654-1 [Araneus ventricosus]